MCVDHQIVLGNINGRSLGMESHYRRSEKDICMENSAQIMSKSGSIVIILPVIVYWLHNFT